MLTDQERQEILQLLHREVVPAIGCTEPMAVARCVARAKELLGSLPARIDLHLSANILKNAMGVGIPGTGGMIGLPIAVAMGAIQHRYVTSAEGIIEDDVDRSIHNLTSIGSRGMDETDRFVLDIMTHKGE